MGKTSKVLFPGHGEFWLIKGAALAPLHHCDDEGHVIDPFAISYAHVFNDGLIRRYNQVIGRAEDLQVIKEVEDVSR